MTERSRAGRLKPSMVGRLVRYYHYIEDRRSEEQLTSVSSRRLADRVAVDETQVRRDLAAISVRGVPRVGYPAQAITKAVRERLGFGDQKGAIIVGAGRLGSAIAAYPGITEYGIEVLGVFDIARRKIGTRVGPTMVRPLQDVPLVVRDRHIQLAVLTVPVETAQETADFLVESGIKAIWNFALTRLKLPAHVAVRNEHILVGLAELAYYLKTA